MENSTEKPKEKVSLLKTMFLVGIAIVTTTRAFSYIKSAMHALESRE